MSSLSWAEWIEALTTIETLAGTENQSKPEQPADFVLTSDVVSATKQSEIVPNNEEPPAEPPVSAASAASAACERNEVAEDNSKIVEQLAKSSAPTALIEQETIGDGPNAEELHFEPSAPNTAAELDQDDAPESIAASSTVALSVSLYHSSTPKINWYSQQA